MSEVFADYNLVRCVFVSKVNLRKNRNGFKWLIVKKYCIADTATNLGESMSFLFHKNVCVYIFFLSLY